MKQAVCPGTAWPLHSSAPSRPSLSACGAPRPAPLHRAGSSARAVQLPSAPSQPAFAAYPGQEPPGSPAHRSHTVLAGPAVSLGRCLAAPSMQPPAQQGLEEAASVRGSTARASQRAEPGALRVVAGPLRLVHDGFNLCLVLRAHTHSVARLSRAQPAAATRGANRKPAALRPLTRLRTHPCSP